MISIDPYDAPLLKFPSEAEDGLKYPPGGIPAGSPVAKPSTVRNLVWGAAPQSAPPTDQLPLLSEIPDVKPRELPISCSF
ncbi:hypothetical protein M1271_05960 [Patescibacteria group bacterium]|nr:hypothetical protein [Patescibacteria group bacterium]MCL5797860.1 hypothetical protein [Patescibacteria group bacterium]